MGPGLLVYALELLRNLGWLVALMTIHIIHDPLLELVLSFQSPLSQQSRPALQLSVLRLTNAISPSTSSYMNAFAILFSPFSCILPTFRGPCIHPSSS